MSDRRFGRFPADHGADVFFRACLAQGIKKLRAVGANSADANKPLALPKEVPKVGTDSPPEDIFKAGGGHP